MWVERCLDLAIENGLEAWWICKAEYAAAEQCGEGEKGTSVTKDGNTRQRVDTHFGTCLGAQTIAKNSGSMLWKPACVCKSSEDMKPTDTYSLVSSKPYDGTYMTASGECVSAVEWDDQDGPHSQSVGERLDSPNLG